MKKFRVFTIVSIIIFFNIIVFLFAYRQNLTYNYKNIENSNLIIIIVILVI